MSKLERQVQIFTCDFTEIVTFENVFYDRLTNAEIDRI